jgi:hypothetical protein
MSGMLRRLSVATVAVLACVAMPAVALAAAPSNDIFAGATAASVGFSEVLDTSEATTDADDAQLNESCGAPVTDASVWYTIEGANAGVLVDVSGSNYSAGVLVGVGSQGNLVTVACGPGGTAFFAESGTTYYVLAIDDQNDGGGNGGNLSIAFGELPPPPTIDFTVNRTGQVNTRTGVATISGTFSCQNSDFVEIGVDARQNVGRFVVRGFGSFFDSGTCDGTSHSWSADIYPENGKFAGGKTLTANFSFGCGLFECTGTYVEQTVMLRGGKR